MCRKLGHGAIQVVGIKREVLHAIELLTGLVFDMGGQIHCEPMQVQAIATGADL
jgi:hypothetical protein